MRKFFILTLMAASLLLVSCVEKRNMVVLEKFVPISEETNCAIELDGDHFQIEGSIDLAFNSDYQLAFQIKNNVPSSDGGSSNSSLTTAETNYFYAEKVEIEYEWDYKPQVGGAKIRLDQNLWNKKTRRMEYPIVVDPNGSPATGYVHVFEDAQARDLLEQVEQTPNYDWIASPLIIKIKVIGELADGTKIETNKMNFTMIPTFGTTIQPRSTYYEPAEGFGEEGSDDEKAAYEAKKARYDAIKDQCEFAATRGCIPGQDYAEVNCHSGDTAWQKYVAEKHGWTYYAGAASGSVVEMIYNNYKKSAGDGGKYVCCPAKEPEEPEEPEEDEGGNTGNE